jgi:outer membrane receptor protein involved in Fe transport
MRGKFWLAAATGILSAPADTPAQIASAADDIIVTAQRREQRLQDVGLSLTNLSTDDIARLRPDGIDDLVRAIPGLQATPSPNDTPIYILRGVGFYETSVAAYPDVATYIDQAPLVLPAFTRQTLFDLERVEVMKGPQGTLFGNNATGGALNIVAAKPRDRFEAEASATYGRFNRAELEGYVTGPLAKDLDARLAFRAVHTDDWQQSYTRSDGLGAARSFAARLLLDWAASSRLHLTLNVNGWLDRSDPEAPQLARKVTLADLQAPVGASGPTGTITPAFALLSYPAAPGNARAADWDPGNRPFANNHLVQTALTATWDLARDARLTTITSYVTYGMHNATEGDGTALFDLDITSDRARARSFFQEARLSNRNDHDRLRWAVGAGLERTTVYETVDLRFNDASTGAIQGFSADSYDSDQRMRNEALFGSMEFDLASRLTLKAGTRYSWARRETVNGSYQTPGYLEPFPGSPGLTGLINTLWGQALTPLFCPGKSFVPIPAGGSVSVDPSTCTAGLFRGALHDRNLSWLGGANLRASGELLLYANVSRGWKNGSFPTISAPVYDQYQPVTQEELTAFEAGFKTELAGGRIAITSAVFYDDYRNKQVRAKTVNPIFGILDQLVNVPRSRILGAEEDVRLRPLRGLDVHLAGTWLETRVLRYDGIVGDRSINGLLYAVRAPFDGTQLPFAPHWQGSASADYSFRLGPHLGAFLGGSVSAQSRSYASLEMTPQDLTDAALPGHAILDLRAGVETAAGWRLSVWGHNVGNHFYLTNATRAYDTVIRYAGRPAEWSITIGRKLR